MESRKSFGVIMILGFILIRSIHFTQSLNFSTDPALFSSRALEIFQNHSLVLIGPTFSINLNGRYAFQGAVIYYFQLLFLLLGNFDPVVSSYLFMLFCALMIVPLYKGTEMLINRKAAILMVMLYTFLPYYINYSKFLWNPNFQLALSPLLIYLMGKYKQSGSRRFLFLTGGAMGVIVQFHYQFFLVIAGIVILYFIKSVNKGRDMLILFSGLAAGFSPLIIFELRHNFYNLQTIYLFFKYGKSVGNNPVNGLADYYFLSISFFALLGLCYLFSDKKLPIKAILITLLIICFTTYVTEPTGGFRMAPGWKYEDELKANQIIEGEKLSGFNVLNLVYDTKAATQKYLLEKDGVIINSDDYLSNKYLFVLSHKTNFEEDPAYEIRTFKPNLRRGEWKISDKVNLYLLERL